MRPVHHYLLETAHRYPDKTAVICDEASFSYERLTQCIQSLAAILVEMGCRKGDRVLILLKDKLDFLIACYAVMAARGIAVPLMEGAAWKTIEQIARHCTPYQIISSVRHLRSYPAMGNMLNGPLILMDATPSREIDQIKSRMVTFNRNDPPYDDDRSITPNTGEREGAMILYTSGTTGEKKGALLSHRNLMQATLNINEFMRIDADICEFVSVPLTHSFGFGRTRCVFCAGGTMVALNRIMNPAVVIQYLEQHRCDALSMVPAGIALFFGRMEPQLRHIGPNIRFIEIGSAPMRRDHKLKLLDMFPNARMCMHYGLTEASRSAFIEFSGERDKLDTVGRSAPHVTISIRDENGRTLKNGETGEIAVRGAHVMEGYWRNEALNLQRFTDEGWFKTGDYGFLDADGYLHLLGRKDDIINMGGLKISPLEVEERILEMYPDYEMCIVGISDPAGIAGEVPVLCYVPQDGRTLTFDRVQDALSQRLDQHTMPKKLYAVDRLPRTHNGKIIRQELRRLVEKTPHHQRLVTE